MEIQSVSLKEENSEIHARVAAPSPYKQRFH